MQTVVKPLPRRSSARAGSFGKKPITQHAMDAEGKESFAAIAHDARNVVAALTLFCDLLAQPGVLSEESQHFAGELRAVVSASSALMEQLTALHPTRLFAARLPSYPHHSEKFAAQLPYIDDLANAVQQLKGPIVALAGIKIQLEMECLFAAGRVRLSPESLTRILVNLTRNAAEAMPQGGRIRITVQLGDGGSFLDTALPARAVVLCVQDSGPGIPADQLESIFDAGFSTKNRKTTWPHNAHRGLGLSIVRRLVEAAGGSVRAKSPPGGGARFEVELPLIYFEQPSSGFPADFPERANLEC